jgi:hypothetical protein
MLDLGEPNADFAGKSVGQFERMIAINTGIPNVYYSLAAVHVLSASSFVLAHQNPMLAVEEGLAAVEKCYQVQPRFPDCQSTEGQLRAAQAEWLQQQGKPFIPQLRQAQALARQAIVQTPDNEELLLPLAQISLQLATAIWQMGGRPVAEVAEGISAIEHTLKIAVGWPRALAHQGALLLLRAKLSKDAAARKADLRAGEAAFAAAFVGNPLLKRRFGDLASEVERTGKGE